MRRARSHAKKGDSLKAGIRVYCDQELKRLAGEAADAEGLPLSEYIARVLAAHLGHEELGRIPRKAMGRPRNPIPAKVG